MATLPLFLQLVVSCGYMGGVSLRVPLSHLLLEDLAAWNKIQLHIPIYHYFIFVNLCNRYHQPGGAVSESVHQNLMCRL